jgi:hypothetical protein
MLESSQQCDICQGRTTCYYCGNIRTERKTSAKELELIDIYYNGGKIVHMSLEDSKDSQVETQEISRDMVKDIGSVITTHTYEVHPNFFPFWPEAGKYVDILGKLLQNGGTVGRIITTSNKMTNGRISKIVAFEVKHGEVRS